MPPPRLRWVPGFLVLAAAIPAPVAGQLPPLTPPKGQLRFDLGGRFEFWDQTWFEGIKRDAASDFVRDPLGADFVPGLGRADDDLRRVTGLPAVSLSLGKTSARMAVNVGTAEIGATFGVTSRLMIFGRVPIVRVRVLPLLTIDSTGATAGFNPADPLFGNALGIATTEAFLNQLAAALGALQSRIESGQYDTLPDRLAEAQAALARGRTLQSDLQSLLLGSSFLPIAGTAPAAALNQTIDSLRNRLLAVDSIPFEGSPALPATGLLPGGLEEYATRAGVGLELQPFEPPIYRSIGDIDLGAGFALLNGRPPTRGLAVRSVVVGTVRLRTGKLPDPNSVFDLGTGDRQPDIQGDLVTDIMGSWFGARLSARYVAQLPGPQDRRVTPPDRPLTLAATLAAVERDPGEIVEGAFEPYVRMAPNFSIVAGVRHWRKAEDRYVYAPGQAPIPDTMLDVLSQGSKENGTIVSLGLSLAHTGLRQDGRTGLPLDATVKGQMVVGSTEGRVPVRQSVVFELRLYGKIF